jgi:SAM-dependent methyltransferase
MDLSWFYQLFSARQRRRIRNLAKRLGVERRFLRLRRKGLAYLKGTGIEIGAFEHPAPVPRDCHVRYIDVITPDQAAVLFPEIDTSQLIPPDFVVDIDREGLQLFGAETQDFVIACHVIEHVANPGRFVAELTRVLRAGGFLVIAAPDKNFTFDRARPLTSIESLYEYYIHGRCETQPEDYREIIDFVHPQLAHATTAEIKRTLEAYHRRREHLSVWTAESFRTFLIAAFTWTESVMQPIYEVYPDRNRYEYFGVWKKS